MQFLLLVLMMYTLAMFSFAIAYWAVPLIFQVSAKEAIENVLNGDRTIRSAVLFIQLISAVGTFLIPGLLFAYSTHPKPLQYLGFRKPGKSIQWVLVIFVILGAMPVIMGLESLLKLIPLGKAIETAQKEGEMTMGILLDARSPAQLIWVFIILAITPAVGEEIICRGILLRLINKRTGKTALAIAISSFIFASLHFYNPYGILPIFFAAVLLGYIYYLTGSLWLNIIAHLIHNGLQVILVYAGNSNVALKSTIENDHMPLWLPLTGSIILVISLFLLWKNRTPLPDNWSDDFTQAELMQREN